MGTVAFVLVKQGGRFIKFAEIVEDEDLVRPIHEFARGAIRPLSRSAIIRTLSSADPITPYDVAIKAVTDTADKMGAKYRVDVVDGSQVGRIPGDDVPLGRRAGTP